jgi:hypothetical protein
MLVMVLWLKKRGVNRLLSETNLKLNELLENLRNLELPSKELHQCLFERTSSELNRKISELFRQLNESRSEVELTRVENEARKLASFLFSLESEISIVRQLGDVQRKILVRDIWDYLIKGLEIKDYFKIQTLVSKLSMCYLELLHSDARKRCEEVQRSLNTVLAANEFDPQLKEAWLTLLEPETRTIEELKERLESAIVTTSTLEIGQIRENVQRISEILHLFDELESRIEDYKKIKREWLTPKAIDVIVKGLISGGVNSEEDVVSALRGKLYEDIYSIIYRRHGREAAEAAQLTDKFIRTLASYLWEQVTIQRGAR